MKRPATPSCLPLRCSLEARETPTSLVSRLARRNRCAGARVFCGDLGLSWTAIVRGDEGEIGRLASLAGVNENDLRHWAVRPAGQSRFGIGGEIGTTATMSRSRIRICAECIVSAVSEKGFEGAFRRADWQLLSIHTCEQHNQGLMDVPVSSAKGGIYDIVAHIEQDWQNVCASRLRCIEQRETGLEGYLRRRLTGGCGTSRWIDQLALPVVSRASEMLGARLLYGPAIKTASLTDAILRPAGAAGFEVLSEGPAVLQNCLTELSNEGVKRGRFHQRDYGVFMDWLAGSRTMPEAAPLRQVVREHIINSFPLRPGEIVLGVEVIEPRRITFTSAAKQLGVRPTRLVEHLAKSSAGDHRTDRAAQSLTTEEFKRLKAEIQDKVTLREAAEIIGCTQDQLSRFLDAAMLTRSAAGAKRMFLSRQDVEAFMAPIMRLPCCTADDQFLPLDKISNRLKWTVHDLYGAFLNGQLSDPRRLPGQSGISALLLSEDQVRRDLFVDPSEIISLRAAAKAMTANIPTIHVLIASGHLRSVRTKGSRATCAKIYVDKHSLEEFSEQYLTLGEMVAKSDMSRGQLARYLDRLGVPVAFKTSQASRIYRRDLVSQTAIP